MLYKEVVTEKECLDVATLLVRLVLWRSSSHQFGHVVENSSLIHK
jgi:hypothetical protein